MCIRDRSSILQPLANASVVTTRMDGYTETGAGNAGLNVGKQEWTTCLLYTSLSGSQPQHERG